MKHRHSEQSHTVTRLYGKIIALMLTLFCVMGIFSACGMLLGTEVTYMVDDSVYKTVLLTKDAEFAFPKAPTKDGYVFEGWSVDADDAESILGEEYVPDKSVTLHAVFSEEEPEPEVYKVKFVDWDGTVLKKAQSVTEGEAADAPDEPIRREDEGYTYEFSGWSNSFKRVRDDMTITAEYTATPKIFTVVFLAADGTELAREQVAYSRAATAPTVVLPENTVDTEYSFGGWSADISNIRGNLTVTAQIVDAPRLYTVAFVDRDGAEIVTEQCEYGTAVTPPTAPVVPATAQYTYTFAGWSTDAYTAVTEDLTVTAQYTETVNSYEVVFVNGESIVSTQAVDYGMSAALPTPPTRDSTAQYDYVFTAWSDTAENITGPLTLTAEYEEVLRYYTVTHRLPSGTVLAERSFAYGTQVTYDGEIPQLAATNTTIYTFEKWSAPFAAVTANSVYTAVFTESDRLYTVYFQDWNGKLLQRVRVKYMETAVSTVTPTRPMDDRYEYEFVGWSDNAAQPVTRDETICTAEYNAVGRTFAVYFVDWNGTVLSTAYAQYGNAATAPTAPTRPATQQYSYTFDRWQGDYSIVVRDTTIIAQYRNTVNKYTVSFVDYNQEPIEQVTVPYGSKVVPAIPQRISDNYYTYTFRGWVDEQSETVLLDRITADTYARATYYHADRMYNVTFLDFDETELEHYSVKYGAEITPPTAPTRANTAQYEYEFIGWDTDDYTFVCEDDLQVKATYDSILRDYNVCFRDYDGEILFVDNVLYGSAATPPTAPTRESTAQYNYEFSGWDQDVSCITHAFNVYAEYDAITRQYAVTFLDGDGTILSLKNTDYGTAAVAPETVPTQTDEHSDEYVWVFSAWDTDYSIITAPITIRPVFTKQYLPRNVRFVDWDGTVLQQGSVDYGTAATPPTQPARTGTVAIVYEFSGWDTDYSCITADTTVTAQYTPSPRLYTVRFYGYNETLVSEQSVAYGTAALLPQEADITLKPSTAEFTYAFAQWQAVTEGTDTTSIQTDCDFTAVYTPSVRVYTVDFLDVRGNLLQSVPTPYGEGAEYTGATPTKPMSTTKVFTFSEWDTDYDCVTTDITVKPLFTEATRYYTVTYLNADSTLLYKDETVTYNGNSSYGGETPTMAPSAQYDYTFKGWSTILSGVVRDRTVTAEYTATLRRFTVRFTSDDGLTEYDVVENVQYGTEIRYTGDTPEKASTAKYYYVFNSWSCMTAGSSLASITADTELVAVFDERIRSYTVEFRNWDGRLLDTCSVLYESAATYGNILPQKEGTEQYVFVFCGWDKTFDYITEDTTVTAQFTPELRKLTVRFLNDDGSVLETQRIVYGNAATTPVGTPTKASTDYFYYDFEQWVTDYSRITADLDVTASYTQHLKMYTYTFVDAEGNVLDTKTTTYRGIIVAPIPPTVPGYVHSGWEYVREGGNVPVTSYDVMKREIQFVSSDETVRAVYTAA